MCLGMMTMRICFMATQGIDGDKPLIYERRGREDGSVVSGNHRGNVKDE